MSKNIARWIYSQSASVICEEDVIYVFKSGERISKVVHKNQCVSANSESEVMESLLQRLGKKDVFYDIGANFGRYSCLIGKVHPSTQVFAFEPNPEAADFLRENLRWNRVNADVIEYALSNCNGEISLDLQEGVERARIQADSGSTSDSVTVKMTTLDNLLERESLPPPSVLKIDVEGAELKVIEGMEMTLKGEDLRLLFCEVHPYLMKKMGDEEMNLFARLKDSGFEVEVIDQRDVQYEDGGSEVQKFIRASRRE
ncbi:FkbM family methyltransferase [Salinibacter ruber]|jgi:FkbM family methyltransferase|uniref:FkbM family methyltransferase n=1 Tax=Salinibacter ruber TaxID=146919 RepID=UPI00216A8929|nr:FkbM family methyltransferase [Salinibacter ruber]MCS4149400.1 FkbM family methyltransferase [Salinibacter ruber]